MKSEHEYLYQKGRAKYMDNSQLRGDFICMKCGLSERYDIVSMRGYDGHRNLAQFETKKKQKELLKCPYKASQGEKRNEKRFI